MAHDRYKELREDPAVRDYMMVCLVALMVITVALFDKGFGKWAMLPILVGGLGLLGRWRAAPLLLLATLGCLMPARSYGLDPLNFVRFVINRHEFPSPLPGLSMAVPALPTDWILSAAVLAYVAAHYRLQGLIYHVFPLDPRLKVLPRPEGPDPQALPPAALGTEGMPRATPGPTPTGAGRRSTGLVNLEEIGMLILALPLWAALGYLLWRWLGVVPPLLQEVPGLLRPPMVLLWLAGTSLALAAAVFGYLGMKRAGREASLLYLQDQLWIHTGRDQGRVNRFLVWARWRRQGRGEKK